MDRRSLIGGAAALALFPRTGEAAAKKKLVIGGGWAPYPGAAVHCDFVRRRYFWAGAFRKESDFTTFAAPSFGDGANAGLLPTASTNVTMTWSVFNLAAPIQVIVVAVPATTPAATRRMLSLFADGSNQTNFLQTNATAVTITNTTAGSADVSGGVAIANGTRYAFGASIQTNNYLTSFNGTLFAAADPANTVPAWVTAYFARGNGASVEFLGSLRHVVILPGAAASQAELDNHTAKLANY